MKKNIILLIGIIGMMVSFSSCGVLDGYMAFSNKAALFGEKVERVAKRYDYYVNSLPVDVTDYGTKVLYIDRANASVSALKWGNNYSLTNSFGYVVFNNNGRRVSLPKRWNDEKTFTVPSRSPVDGLYRDITVSVYTLGTGNSVVIELYCGGHKIETYWM